MLATFGPTACLVKANHEEKVAGKSPGQVAGQWEALTDDDEALPAKTVAKNLGMQAHLAMTGIEARCCGNLPHPRQVT